MLGLSHSLSLSCLYSAEADGVCLSDEACPMCRDAVWCAPRTGVESLLDKGYSLGARCDSAVDFLESLFFT